MPFIAMPGFEKNSKIIVQCFFGIPEILSEEIESLGLKVHSKRVNFVETRGSLRDCIELNYKLRTANKVLYLVSSFKARSPADLKSRLAKIQWSEILSVNGYFSVHGTVDNPKIRDSRYANLIVKDAIADHFVKNFNKRPDSGPERKCTVFYIHWNGDDFSIYIDTSGETIARHGYRKIPYKAPLQESLAAALIMSTGWDKKSVFINPMCGSGTLAIEAALIAKRIYPGRYRNNWGFMHIRGYKSEMLIEYKRNGSDNYSPRMVCTDHDPKAISAARKNARAAGVEKDIHFEVCDFKESPVPEEGGVIMMNPEYGERLGEEQKLIDTYSDIGDWLKKKCTSYRAHVFTGNPSLAKQIGLRTSSKKTFYNAKIECRLLEYEMYRGTKKNKSENP